MQDRELSDEPPFHMLWRMLPRRRNAKMRGILHELIWENMMNKLSQSMAFGFFCLFANAVLVVGSGFGRTPHDGPDPLIHFVLNSRTLQFETVPNTADQTGGAISKKYTIESRLGPNANVDGQLTIAQDSQGHCVHFDGSALAVLADDFTAVRDQLPDKELTVSAWLSVEQPQDWGGILGVLQDNGSAERGWIVGYNQRRFYFGLSTEGANDGNGMMTYLESEARYEPGRTYHVCAVYDGQEMQLYINGKLSGSSRAQSGKILYPQSAPLVLGGYKDKDEDFRHVGRIREVALYDLAAKAEWAAEEFEHQKQLADLPVQGVEPLEFEFAVRPYLQFATTDSMTIMWETTRPATSMVKFGESAEVATTEFIDAGRYVHEVTLKDLQPETQYFYQSLSRDGEGQEIASEVSTFQTASLPETPFAFAVISDTQNNPEVAAKVAAMAWAQRPNFLLHPGDLVGTGTKDHEWKQQFFPSMHELISRVPMYPVLGNHEVNARNYYDYMSLPAPEYYYQFRYGNAEFFMLDTNKKVDPDSEQYRWLDEALGQSEATWKIVCHHHPPYSSDENDYGDLWKSNKSTRGDLRVRMLCPLYDKHGVDIVWCGHIHSYERTWPLADDSLAKTGEGTVYMITGGGGGGLETAGPYRPHFQNNVRRGHHYCMVAINGGTLEFKAFDLENRLFDTLTIEKQVSSANSRK